MEIERTYIEGLGVAEELEAEGTEGLGSEVGEDLRRFRLAGIYLNTRYRECKEEGGHREPDKARNLCGHCFKRLSYKTELAGKRINGERAFEENVDRCRGLIEMVRQYDL